MSTESTTPTGTTTHDLAIFEAWNAVQLLDLLNKPAYTGFGQWMDAELATLEAKWRHASSPKALRGHQGRCRSRR